MDRFHLLSHTHTEADHGNILFPAIFRVGATLSMRAVVGKKPKTDLYGPDINIVFCDHSGSATGDWCAFMFLQPLHMADLISH